MEETSKEVRFECQQCGMCCIGFGTTKVILIGKDLVNLSKAVDNPLEYISFEKLHLKPQNLKATWIDTTYGQGYICLKYQNEITSPCIFLKDNKCTIYNHRPDMCRMFPFDYGVNVIDSDKGRNIEVDIAPRDFCKGVGKGERLDMKSLANQAIASYNDCVEWKKFAKEWNKNPRSFKMLLEELIKRYG